MFLHLYRMYITKINTEKVTEVWMSKDLEMLYFRYLAGDLVDKIPISKMLGIANATSQHKNSHLCKISIYYPVVFKDDWKQKIKPETKQKFEKMKEEFASRHGDTGKKLIEQDDLYRSMQTRLLFCKTNNLRGLKDWGLDDEKTEFYEE